MLTCARVIQMSVLGWKSLESEKNTERKTSLRRRAQVYLTLARLFSYPKPETLELFSSEEANPDLDQCLSGEFDMEKHYNRLREFANPADNLLNLEIEYTRLFINAFPTVVVPPYGSLYLENSKEVLGDSTAEVLKIYNQAGLTVTPDNDCWLADHIAVELEFAAYLLQSAAEEKDEENTYQELWRKFSRKFLWSWTPQFFTKVAQETEQGFYREAAELAKDFLLYELQTKE